MSIYTELEKRAMKRMPRSQFADAALPYKDRKKHYKQFMQERAALEDRDVAAAGRAGMIPGAIIGGIGGGLMGLPLGPAAIGTGLIGAGLGAGVGYLAGKGGAESQNQAIGRARDVVRGGQYDKALQDEVTKYRAVKKKQEEARRRAEAAERRRMHRETRNELREIRRAQAMSSTNTTGGPSYYNNRYSGRSGSRYNNNYSGRRY